MNKPNGPDNPLVKRLRDILEPHYDELYSIMGNLPEHSFFWDYFHSAFYQIAIERSGVVNVQQLARYLRIKRTTLFEILKRFAFNEWLDGRKPFGRPYKIIPSVTTSETEGTVRES
jgi:hypothetical protein